MSYMVSAQVEDREPGSYYVPVLCLIDVLKDYIIWVFFKHIK